MEKEQQFKRNIAFKFRIGDLLLGKPIMDPTTQKFIFLELGDRKIIRVNLIGNVVDKYESGQQSSNYIFFTIDDGSGQIKLKSFGEDSEKFRDLKLGQTVAVIGVLRNFNNETYVSPEIIKEHDPRYLLVRKLEVEKQRKKEAKPIHTKEQAIAIKDKILGMIKGAEQDGGLEKDKIILEAGLRDVSPESINQEIKSLIEEGIVFEPRPGKLRYLG